MDPKRPSIVYEDGIGIVPALLCVWSCKGKSGHVVSFGGKKATSLCLLYRKISGQKKKITIWGIFL